MSEKQQPCQAVCSRWNGTALFWEKGLEIAHQFHYTAQNPSVSRARNITEKILEEYLNKELDEVVIIYTKMLNGVQTETETRHLLPLEKEHFNKNVPVGVQMEQLAMVPSAEALMENIIQFIFRALYMVRWLSLMQVSIIWECLRCSLQQTVPVQC